MLTNDDGILAEGLQTLKSHLECLPEVELWVVAPDRERSASGHSITIHQPLQVQELAGNGKTKSWAVSGTPADCTKLALQALLETRPDLVVSGINRGPNLGQDVYYSGTVSAAVESALLGVPALAVSLTAFENLDYTFAAKFAAGTAWHVLKTGLPRGTLLNINVPALDPGQVAGVAVTRLGVRRYRDAFDRRVDPRGRTYYWLTADAPDHEEPDDTDIGAIRNNLISITPIRLDLTHHDLMGELRQWVADVKLCVKVGEQGWTATS
ncbi:MAG: 5'/3'-nucleotidase SurE [Bacillota bacterium]